MLAQPKVISVFGSSQTAVGSPDYEVARTAGRLLAEAGFTVLTGGYSGTMEAVSRGAREAGGHVIGVTVSKWKQSRKLAANAWLVEEATQHDYMARLLYLVHQSDGHMVLSGGVGTLTELSLTWSLMQVDEINRRPLMVVGTRWRRALRDLLTELFITKEDLNLLLVVETVEEAVEILTERLLQH